MKVRIKFSKQGAMKFIGHLDVMRYFQKAIRRAQISPFFTQRGYSPHQIMSFASPLGVGLTSHGEYMDIEVKEAIPSREALERLNRVMVEGMEVLSYRQVPEEKASKAMSRWWLPRIIPLSFGKDMSRSRAGRKNSWNSMDRTLSS